MHRVCLFIICTAYGKHECREVHDRYDSCDWGRGSLTKGSMMVWELVSG
jgi:hypothetical protein